MRNIPIYITRLIPEPGLSILKNYTQKLIIHKNNIPPTKYQIIRDARDAPGILCLLNDKLDRDCLPYLKNLRVISIMAAGYDNIDIEYCKNHGIVVTNTPEILTQTTADFVFAMILASARNIVQADRFTKAGYFKGWDPHLFCGTDVHGKVLGIVGAGKIGQAVGIRATGFNMKILYTSKKRKLFFELKTGAKKVTLEKLLRESDFVSLNCPLNDSTYHLIGKRELKLMKKDAILINASRGAVVDERSLIKALKAGWIRSAALDVYEKEPRIPEELLRLKNVLLLPHIGSASSQTRAKMSEIAAENLIAVLENKTPLYFVK